jgi:hypothetical protein
MNTIKNFGQGQPNAPTFLSIDSCSETPEERWYVNQKILTMILLELFDFKDRISEISKIHISIMDWAREV